MKISKKIRKFFRKLGFEIEEPTPRTVEELLDEMIERTPESELAKAAAMTEDEMCGLHFSFGMQIRNTFNLWDEKSASLKYDLWHNYMDDWSRAVYQNHWNRFPECAGKFEGSNMHADDASNEILKLYLKRCRIESTKNQNDK